MKTWRHLSPPALLRSCKARVPVFLKSLVTLFLFSVLFCYISKAQQPSNAHRWDAGDGWTYNTSTNTWEPVVYPANNNLPKGIVRCASAAEEEGGLEAFVHTYDGVFSIGNKTNCFNPDNGSHDIASVSGPTAGVTDIVWFNFDIRPFAGSYQFQIVTNQGDLGWALFYVDDTHTQPVNGTNTISGRFPQDPVTGLSGVLGANYENLVYQDCGTDFNGGWATITVPKFSKPTNYYLAMWPLGQDHFENSANLLYKSRFGCGETPITCSFEKFAEISTACNGDGTYTVCQDFVGANGQWALQDNATTKATRYEVTTYRFDNSQVDHFTSTDLSTTPISFILTNLGSNGAIRATVCATYAAENDYNINLSPGGLPDPPSGYTGCNTGSSFSGTGLTEVATPSATVTQPDCFTSDGTIQITNPIEGVTYTLTGVTSYTDNTGKFSNILPGTYILTASLNGSCSSKGEEDIVVNESPGTLDIPVATVATQPDCITATGTVQVTNPVEGVTYTLSNADNSYNADKDGLFSGVVPGTYILSANIGDCSSKGDDDVVINPQPLTPTATISGGPFCKTGTTQLDVTSGPTDGTFSADPAGLSISSSGLIDLAASDAGTYTVTYSFTNGTCPNTTTSFVTINSLPTSTISGGSFCKTGTTQLNVTSGPTDGAFSAAPAGLSINSSGLINLAASDVGTYTVTYSFTDGTCSNSTTSSVTIKTLPAASIGVSTQSCTGGVAKFTLTATTNGTSFAWSTSGDGSFSSINSSPTEYTPGNNDKANGVTITLSTNLNYCTNSTTKTLRPTPCGPIYSLTQGFYGNVGGKVCTPLGYQVAGPKTTMPGLIISSINNMPGQKLILGSATKSFTMGNTTLEANNLIKYLPGSKTPDKLAGIYNITNALPPLASKKIANVFLTQTITLALNVSIPNNTLGSFVMNPGYLTTQKADPGTCPSTKVLACFKDASAISSLKITSNANLMNVLANQTVDSLLRLASKALGGGALPAGVTISDVNNAVDVINKSFDGGRFILGYYATQQSCSTIAAATIVSSVSMGAQNVTDSKISVRTYPNPYTSIVNFSIVSPVSGKAVLETYNIHGQKLAIIFQGNIDAGVQNNIKYHVPAGNRVPMMYKLTIGNKIYHGTILPSR